MWVSCIIFKSTFFAQIFLSIQILTCLTNYTCHQQKKNVTFVFHFSSFSSPLPFKIALFLLFNIEHKEIIENKEEK
jgi:hypothetical protein